MAMTTCTDCQHQLSTTAPACPGCGARQRVQPGFPEMVLRIAVAVVLLIVILAVVGYVVSQLGSS